MAARRHLDTSEVRWFVDGALPSALVSWFSAGTTTLEIREDAYRLDGSPDLGLKRRNHDRLELKVRCDVGDAVEILGAAGRIEDWSKLGDVDFAEVPSTGVERWADVHKVVLTRTYRIDPIGTALPTRTRSPSAGCDVELASVTVGDVEAWTFAFEAWGPAANRRRILRASTDSFAAETPLPPVLVASLDQTVGYPEWLTTVTGTPVC
jgi:hypothetical protein